MTTPRNARIYSYVEIIQRLMFGPDQTVPMTDRPTPTEGYVVGGAGYVVGGAGGSGEHFDDSTGNDARFLYVCRFFAGGQLLQDPPSAYAGRWTDTDGTVYLDWVDIYHSRQAAIELAALRGEKAIWDLANNREIRITDDDVTHAWN